jgi:hypothetical protein
MTPEINRLVSTVRASPKRALTIEELAAALETDPLTVQRRIGAAMATGAVVVRGISKKRVLVRLPG